MFPAVLLLAGEVLPVLGQFVLPVLVGAVVVVMVVRDVRRRSMERKEDEALPLLIVPPIASVPDARPLQPLRAPSDRFKPAATADPEVDVGSETVSIELTEAGTVQLLPGRLEMVKGMGAGREFRFIRAPGQIVTEVTLGRASGPSHRHVQLPVSTVSRMHARLRYEGGQWSITNLSLTNPVRVNDRELFGRHDTKRLADRDRIQIGEVELRFLEDG